MSQHSPAGDSDSIGASSMNDDFHEEDDGSEHLNYPELSREWMLAKCWLTGHLKPPDVNEHLDLKDQGIRLEELTEICKDLGSDPDLKSLDISGNFLGTVNDPETGEEPIRPADGHPYFPTPGAEVLAGALKQNQALTHVDLSRNGLGDYGQVSALLLLEALVGKERLAIFDFSANGLVGPDGTRYTALSMLTKQVLPTWPHLMHFTLAFNELHAEAAKLLAGALHDAPNLVSLDLGCNRLGEDPRGDGDPSGVTALSASLAQHLSLTSLNLRDNRLGNKECAKAVSAAAAMPALVSLDLSGNLCSTVGACAVLDAFWCDEHLQHLNLSGNPLSQGDLSGGGSGLGAIAKMLKQNACLTCVELAGVGLTDKAASAFLSALKRDNTTLFRLEVGGNAPYGLSWSKERDLAEACEANMELAQVASNPSRFDFERSAPSTRKALLRKIHTLPSRPLRKLTQNPTFMGDAAHLAEVEAEERSLSGASGHFSGMYVEPLYSREARDGVRMHKRLLELVPPSEEDLLATATGKLDALKAAKMNQLPAAAHSGSNSGAMPNHSNGGSSGVGEGSSEVGLPPANKAGGIHSTNSSHKAESSHNLGGLPGAGTALPPI